MNPTDGDIIARVLAGDRAGFNELLERHGLPIWSTLRATLRNVEDAREVFQETWLRAYQRLDSLREMDRLRSWLLSIAFNLTRQIGRRETQGPAIGPLESAGEVAGSGHSAEHLAEEDELILKLRREMAALPERQREVVDLRVNHGLTHAEIAKLLGIREETSRANHYQALRGLRARFDAERDEDQRHPR